MADNDLFDVNEQIITRKDDIAELVKVALRVAGIADVHIKEIHLEITKRGPQCPPEQTPVWEAVPQPDGSILFQWVCK